MSTQKIKLLQNVRNFIRRPFTDIGGYSVVLTMADGEVLCPTCARSNYRLISQATRNDLRDGWQVADVDVYWEGPTLTCGHCDTEIASEYGDPEEVAP